MKKITITSSASPTLTKVNIAYTLDNIY